MFGRVHSMSSDDNNELSAYERQRMETIKANRAVLESLGLGDSLMIEKSTEKTGKQLPLKREREAAPTTRVLRSCTRTLEKADNKAEALVGEPTEPVSTTPIVYDACLLLQTRRITDFEDTDGIVQVLASLVHKEPLATAMAYAPLFGSPVSVTDDYDCDDYDSDDSDYDSDGSDRGFSLVHSETRAVKSVGAGSTHQPPVTDAVAATQVTFDKPDTYDAMLCGLTRIQASFISDYQAALISKGHSVGNADGHVCKMAKNVAWLFKERVFENPAELFLEDAGDKASKFFGRKATEAFARGGCTSRRKHYTNFNGCFKHVALLSSNEYA